jgi:cell division transport system permease protein
MNTFYQLFYEAKMLASSIRENRSYFFLIVTTIVLSMYILGLFGLMFSNVHSLLDRDAHEKHMSALIKNTVTEHEVFKTIPKIRALDLIEEVRYIAKDEARGRFLTNTPQFKKLVDGLSVNPFPASLEIILTKPVERNVLKKLAREIMEQEIFEEILYEGVFLVRYLALIRAIEYLGFLFIAILFIAVIFIVSNTIKLSLYKRKREIEIMYLVGATRSFIKLPIYIESCIHSICGTSLATGLLFVSYLVITMRLKSILFFELFNTSFSFLSFPKIVFLFILSLVIGIVSTMLSVNRFLEISR